MSEDRRRADELVARLEQRFRALNDAFEARCRTGMTADDSDDSAVFGEEELAEVVADLEVVSRVAVSCELMTFMGIPASVVETLARVGLESKLPMLNSKPTQGKRRMPFVRRVAGQGVPNE